MFAPPPKTNELIKYAFMKANGWGPLTEPFEELRKKTENSFLISPRGTARLLTFLRSDHFDRMLDKNRHRKFFYQQMGDYFCFGDGKVPGLLGIRFYIATKGIPNFYDTDQFGDPLRPATDFDGVIPVYERDCSDI